MNDELPEGFALEEPSSDLPAGFEYEDEKYGGLGQQLITGAEGAASALTLGLSTAAERALGVNPEDIQARREINPGSHMLGQGVGLAGAALIPVLGEASALRVMEGAGAAGVKALGMAGAESALGRIGAGATKSAIENMIFQAGDEISKKISEDPSQSVETAITNVGLSGLFGGAVGGTIGAVSPLWEATMGKRAAAHIDELKGELAADEGEGIIASTLSDLKSLKNNSSEIQAAADEIGAPVLESQISRSKHIQDIDSMLMQSPTPTGVARQQTLQKGLDAAENAVNSALTTTNNMTQVEVGNALKAGLTSKLEAEYKPISELYDLVKQSTDNIPVSDKDKQVIAANIKKLEGYKFTGSNMRQVGDSLLENLEHIQTVDDIKRFTTDLNARFRMNASHEVGQVADMLRNLEESSIIRAAESMANESGDQTLKKQVLSLIDERKTANAAYKELKDKMSDLGAVLGKKRPKGATDFLNFIEELTPESAAKKLFAKNNSEFLKSFSDNFPEEMRLLVDHQKNVIREAATKDGIVNTNSVLREVNKLSPEVQKLMFAPEELAKIKAAQTYLEAIPKNINPSGTSKSEAYRRFFTNPASATIESLRDMGLGKLMKSVVKSGEEEAFAKSIFPAIAKDVLSQDPSPQGLKSAVDYGMQIIRGERQIFKATRSVFKSSREVAPGSFYVSEKEREKLDKSVAESLEKPERLLSMGGNTAYYMPQQASAMGETAGRVIQFLQAAKPKPFQGAPLDKMIEPSKAEKAAYDRVLDIAQQPLSVMERIRNSTLLPSDVQALRVMYPSLYNNISLKLTDAMVDTLSKNETIPYKVRQSLSLFLGQPLDSSLKPESIIAAQGTFAAQQQQKMQSSSPPAKANPALKKMARDYRTPDQAALERQKES